MKMSDFMSKIDEKPTLNEETEKENLKKKIRVDLLERSQLKIKIKNIYYVARPIEHSLKILVSNFSKTRNLTFNYDSFKKIYFLIRDSFLIFEHNLQFD